MYCLPISTANSLHDRRSAKAEALQTVRPDHFKDRRPGRFQQITNRSPDLNLETETEA
jgi:hypothetical protein